MFKTALKWEIKFFSISIYLINCEVDCKNLYCALFNKSLTSPLLTATYSTKHIELTDLSTFLVDKFILSALPPTLSGSSRVYASDL